MRSIRTVDVHTRMCPVNNAVNIDNVATEAKHCCHTHVAADNMKHNLGLRVMRSIFCQISTKSQTLIFTKIRPVGAALMDAKRQTDRHDEANWRHS